MSDSAEGFKLMDACCGNGKDNVIALSTVALDASADGKPRPCVRDVDAFYEDGVFYVVTSAQSNKMRQLAQNDSAAFAVCFEGIYGTGTGVNLGWVLDPKNAALRAKLRKAFAAWYDAANDEQSENCVILALQIKRATIMRDHGAVYHELDFPQKHDR